MSQYLYIVSCQQLSVSNSVTMSTVEVTGIPVGCKVENLRQFLAEDCSGTGVKVEFIYDRKGVFTERALATFPSESVAQTCIEEAALSTFQGVSLVLTLVDTPVASASGTTNSDGFDVSKFTEGFNSLSSSEKKQVLSSLSADSQDVPQIQQTPVRLSVNLLLLLVRQYRFIQSLDLSRGN